MIKWLIAWWHARQRAVDMEILLPICLSHGRDLTHAKAAFAVHAFNDEAWMCLGHDAVYDFIDKLEPTP